MNNSDLFSFDRAEAITRSRAYFRPDRDDWFPKSPEAEGGCGVTGFACSIPVSGKNIYEPSIQMRNRGNGKGGGIAACGLIPEEMGVSREVLDESYILQVALLNPDARGEVEKEFVTPFFDVQHSYMLATVDDYRDVPLLEVRPPDVMRYFVRVKPDVLQKFSEDKKLGFLSPRELEDEFVFQNSNRINEKFYASLGEKRAFVLSHARNLLILKIVGYAEAVVQYYQMADTKAHVWIAHQRYPTRGRVWHPGGCHPFIGMNEALVHNGDFANYRAVSEFLAQRNLYPQFLTDTETSVMLFDLMTRTYKYPMECIIEALAPTSELDFDRLTPEKQRLYREIQTVHTHAAPDGPWFFIIARNLAEKGFQLVGITDTAMLRPQVFALQEGEVSIGLVCSEKQAIDATLANLAAEDSRFTPVADKYWNARGGSFTDGGAFLMSVVPKGDGDGYDLITTNKFGEPLHTAPNQVHCDLSAEISCSQNSDEDASLIEQALGNSDSSHLYRYIVEQIVEMDYDRLRWLVNEFATAAAKRNPLQGIEALTLCIDRRYPTGTKKRSSVISIMRQGLQLIFDAQPLFTTNGGGTCRRVDFETRDSLRGPENDEQAILIDAREFQPEGRDCDSYLSVDAYHAGWRHIVHYNSRGTRFHGAGFGPETDGLRIDCYDNPGDYLASGMDGLEIFVHGNAQDQLCQISKRGKLAVFGDVGQTFMYGAKGGDVYIMGNAAGRPMINAVGRPKVVINGTALDFLAESFMAGDPLNGGGFAIVNGLQVNDDGSVEPLDLPYPGSNLLSLASGGAIYVRDPHQTLVDEQLNAGMFRRLSSDDWKLILPYLQENERLFNIQVERDLLTVDGSLRAPAEVYRKVMPHSDEEIEMELEGLGE
ncbi:MAG: glutamate synthase [Kiritimatiellia bacterium]|jgi:glutamate synthase domain-containing protein 1/glutamate synthase domain-containing protein 3|nr:glutamate synthase [Kiritimatiellia bacterium]